MSLRSICSRCLQLRVLESYNPVARWRKPSLATWRKLSSMMKISNRSFYILTGESQDEAHSTDRSSMDREEVNKFQQLSQEWWNETGNIEALHLLNKLRVPLIRDGLLGGRPMKNSTPLKGMEILDVGCGGGILSEPLARLGGNVTGIDMADDLLDVAEFHSLHDPAVCKNLRYICGEVENLVATDIEKYDAVVASEVLEHISDLSSFLQSCCDLVKPGGSIFVTSINKTAIAYAFAVVAAEAFNIVPKGSHNWDKLVSLQELQSLLERYGFVIRLVHGIIYDPVFKKWSWISNTSCNFAIHAVKSDFKEPEIGEENIETLQDDVNTEK